MSSHSSKFCSNYEWGGGGGGWMCLSSGVGCGEEGESNVFDKGARRQVIRATGYIMLADLSLSLSD